MKYLLLISFWLVVHRAMCQDEDSLAKISFSRSQTAFVDGRYKEALNYINAAEIRQGGTCSMCLYMRIRILDNLSNRDNTYLPDLQSSLNIFFETTDRSTYPSDKYQEIATIKSIKGNLTTSANQDAANAAPSSKEQEQKDYDKAVKAATLEAYKEFLDKYTFTSYTAEIQKKYDALVDQKQFQYEHDKSVKKRIRKLERKSFNQDYYSP